MWMPVEYGPALLMLVVSMLCWGSWANALKLMKGCRFELFYWDYVCGTALVSLVLAFTMGSFGSSGPPFLTDLARASAASYLYALAGGVVFNVSNILLTAAIEVAGLAVAFPVGVGLSIVVGVILNYAITPRNDPVLLFGGVAALLVAIVLDARAFRLHAGAGRRKTSSTGIALCIVSAIGLGLFYPLVAKSISQPRPLGAYSVGVVFMAGMLLSNFVVNTYMMRRPVTGQPPLSMAAYRNMPARWHVLGLLLGGAVWGLGTVFNFVVSSTSIVGPATSFALGDGATMVSALWGILLWREFHGASPQVRRLLGLMFVLFVIGLGSVALSPKISLR